MDREAIEKRILEILNKQMGPYPDGFPKVGQTWYDLGMDEIDQVEFLMAMEDEWDLEIEDSEWDRQKTVQDAVDMIASKVP